MLGVGILPVLLGIAPAGLLGRALLLLGSGPQQAAATVAVLGTGGNGGAAYRTECAGRGRLLLLLGRLPFLSQGVLALQSTAAVLLVAAAVVGSAAHRANHHIVLRLEGFLANRAFAAHIFIQAINPDLL